ncbi:helix-turn-helix transcriptional regulator [Flavobacterium sp. CYK-4]|uniref:helix-turn-helix domain-containing protein n=1 Tax=Flavobacterium lotistagni TaxID=2709660 RepID=UPI00140B9BDF|nr:helix-turn-helix transcriptional regulator [Flavobacterium lotistagni]NHM06661.1 helix-turn-helix transcriptional regulator [Flavobacterium lotistagni]
MKKKESLSALLGLSQQDMALLLGVTRGQFSMFEIGKRSLPTAALGKLAAILSHLKEREAHAKKHPEPINEKLLNECLMAYEREKELERLRRQRRLEKLEQKRAAAQKLQWLADYLSQGKTADAHGAKQIIAYKAKKGFSEKEERELWGLRVRESGVYDGDGRLSTK